MKKFYATTAIAIVSVLTPVSDAKADGVVEGTFVAGSGTFTQSPNLTNITVHTTSSIAEFHDYNIPGGSEVHYEHDADIGHSRNLSRVTGGNASSIMGSLTSADVDVYLINPNGVIFGNGSSVNVPSLVTSTTDISNANFQGGNYKFDIKGRPDAKIINNGSITVAEGGLAAFVAPSVENNGIIVARRGQVALAAGDEFTLDMYGDKLVNFVVSDEEKERLVKQSGTIAAEGGVVLLTVQDANHVVNNVVNLDGVTEAKTIKVLGDTIILGGNSRTVARDGNNGGNIDIHGRNTTVNQGAQLIADATTNGNGGNVAIYGDDILNFDGIVSAQGKGTGVGGFVETSGDVVAIGDDTLVNTLDEQDSGLGLWLIDPTNMTISSAPGSATNTNNATLGTNLNTTSITIDTTSAAGQAGNITVSANVTKTSGSTQSLILNANNNININSGVTISSTSASGGLNVALNADNKINLDGAIITKGGNFSAHGFTILNANAFNLSSTGSINTANGSNGGNVDVNAGKIDVDGTITTAGASKHINLTSDGTANISINNTVDAGAGTITLTEAGSGDIKSTAIGAIKAGVFNANAANGNITLDGTVTTKGNVTLKSDHNIAVNNAVITNGGSFAAQGNTVTYANKFNLTGSINTNNPGLGGLFGGSVNIKAGTIDLNGTTSTVDTFGGSIDLTSDGSGDISVDNTLNAGNGNVTITNVGAGKITSSALGAITGGKVKLSTADGNITTDGSIVGSALSDAIILQSTGLGNITTNGAVTATLDSVKMTTNTGNIVTNAAVKGTNITLKSTDGNITNNSTITSANLLGLGQTVDISTVNGNVIVNGAISASGLGGVTGGDVKLNSTNGNVSILKGITVGNLGTVSVKAHNGHVNLDAAIKSQPVDGIFTLTGDTDLVNVLSNNGIINQGVKIVNDGGTVDLAGGQTFDQTVRINKNLTLQGHAGTVLAPTSMPLFDSNYAGLALPALHGYLTSSLPIAVQPIVFVDGSAGALSDVIIKNLEIDGSGVTTLAGGLTGVGFNNASGAIRNANIHNLHDTIPTGTGIHVNGVGSTVEVAGVDVSEYDIAGVHATGGATVHVKNHSNINGGGGLGLAQVGVLFDNGGQGSVKDSTIANNTGILSAGVAALNAGAVEVDNNDISGSEAGIFVQGTNGVIADGNTIHDNLVGILSDSNNGQFLNNDISVALAGIFLNGGSNNLIQGGNIGLTLDGIALSGTTDTTIDGVTISANGFGVTETNGLRTTIKNSNITLALAGVTSTDSNDLVIDNTDIIGTVNGVTLNNSDNATIRNGSQILGSLQDGVHATDSENFKFKDSTIGGSLDDGIELTNSNNASVINSTLVLNLGAGIEANNSNGLFVDPTLITLNTVGIELNGSNNAVIDDTTFLLNFTDGLRVNNSNNTTVTNSNFIANFDNGIESNGGDGLHIGSGTFLLGNFNNGIQTNGTDNVDISNTLATLNGNDGIQINGGNNVDINTVAALGNFHNGITINNSNGASIFFSTSDFNANNGIEINNSNGVDVALALVGGNGNDGIHANNSDNLDVILSALIGNHDDGIDLRNSDNADVILSTASLNGDNGIEAHHSDNLDVILSSAFLNGRDGIHLQNGSDNAMVLLSLVDGNGRDGIYARNSDGLLVLLSDVSGNDRDGIHLRNSDNANVILSNISHNGRDGIYARGSDDLNVILSNISHNDRDGVHLRNSDDAHIVLNNIHDNDRDGVYARNSNRLHVTLNNIEDNGRDGVHLRNSDWARIRLNNIEGNDRDGIYARGSDHLRVTLNNIENNGRDGVHLRNSDWARIRLNNIEGNDRDGIYARGSDHLRVTLNNIEDNGRDGVHLRNSDWARIRLNNIHDNDRDGIFARGSDHMRVTFNNIHDNDRDGIRLVNSDDARIRFDNIEDNGGAGVNVNHSNDTLIRFSNIVNNHIGVYAHNGFDNLTIRDTTFTGGPATQYSLLVNGNGGPVDLSLIDLLFNGTESDAAIRFEDATDLSEVDVHGVQLMSISQVGWQFDNVSGSPISDVFEVGDIDFNDTVFNNSYTRFDIELINTVMDGDANDATFIGALTQADKEDRVWHNTDLAALGTIFPFLRPINIGNLASDIANRTDLGADYYNPVSTAGRIYDNPSLIAPRATNFNTALDGRVDISGGLNIIGRSIAQLAGLSPAAGGDENSDELNELETSSGIGKGIMTADCSVNYVNNFLADNLGEVSGTCQ